MGVATAFAMAAPWLVDMGLSLTQVGLVIAGANVLAFSTAGPAAGLWLRRHAPRRGLRLSATWLAPAFLGLWLLRPALPEPAWAMACVLLVFCALAVQAVSFNAYFYSLARPGHAATDVALMSAMMSLGALAGFAASGYLAAGWGYAATLAAAALGYAATAVLAARWAPDASPGA